MTQPADITAITALWRRQLLISVAAFGLGRSAVAATTVGSGQLRSESRPVSGFDAIAVAGTIELVVRQGTQERLELSADDNLLPLVETVVAEGRHGRTLSIRLRADADVRPHSPIRAVVDVIHLQSLSAAGDTRLQLVALTSPQLRLSLSGSGKARLDGLSVQCFDLSLAGSGDVRASGAASAVKLSIAGSGDADLSALNGDEVTVSIAGSGDAKVTARQSLSVSIAGSGDVVYGGDAKVIRRSVAGSGSLRQRRPE